MVNNFVHLNLHFKYSLFDGVSNIDIYLKKAKKFGNDYYFALTDDLTICFVL